MINHRRLKFASGGEIQVASAICCLSSFECHRTQFSLTFFYKIHSGTVSLEKDKYLTPAPNTRRTIPSRDSQLTRYVDYSDALKNSFFPRSIPLWNSLPSSVVSSKTTEKFKDLIKITCTEVCVLACLFPASLK